MQTSGTGSLTFSLYNNLFLSLDDTLTKKKVAKYDIANVKDIIQVWI